MIQAWLANIVQGFVLFLSESIQNCYQIKTSWFFTHLILLQIRRHETVMSRSTFMSCLSKQAAVHNSSLLWGSSLFNTKTYLWNCDFTKVVYLYQSAQGVCLWQTQTQSKKCGIFSSIWMKRDTLWYRLCLVWYIYLYHIIHMNTKNPYIWIFALHAAKTLILTPQTKTSYWI